MKVQRSRSGQEKRLASQAELLRDIREIVRRARAKVSLVVNFAMVEAYWLVGKRIVEEEQKGRARAGYGEQLIRVLSRKLAGEFGRGFSESNVWNFRRFYLTYPSAEILYTLCRELSWSHHRLIMRVENRDAREYYIREVADQHWSVRQLERNIHSLYYERLLLSRRRPPGAARKRASAKPVLPSDHLKDPYVLEFLGLPVPPGFSEAEFEAAIVDNLQRFLLELGKGFSFVGRQHRITTETKHFFIDLVFYNYLLKCFVLIDLKVGELTHQDIGQMDMYVRLFEDRMRAEGDNPTIGLILCTEKDETIVRYSVLEQNRRLFASKYRLLLPTEDELRNELERGAAPASRRRCALGEDQAVARPARTGPARDEDRGVARVSDPSDGGSELRAAEPDEHQEGPGGGAGASSSRSRGSARPRAGPRDREAGADRSSARGFCR
jgi:predicted nuclease of restriction endonuclease-like (RecB) superfamily